MTRILFSLFFSSSVASLFAAGCAAHAPATSAPTPTTSVPVRTLAEETRATLEEMVAVDTSHGHETDLLKPIADRLRATGAFTVDLVESAPGRGNLIARYKGSGAKRPLMLLAHVDVVPIEGQPWTVPPFKVTEKEGFLWGRGVNDDKGMAATIVAIALEMSRTRPKLSRDVVFALTADEEGGGDNGVLWLVQNRRALIDAEIALNEGGGQRLDDAGGRVIEVPINVAEKIFQSYSFTVRGAGGHSSVPPTDVDPVVVLAHALVKVGEHKFPARVIPATREQLAAEAKLEKGPVAEAEARISAAGAVNEADERIVFGDRFANARVRTTCVTTQLRGAPQDNVLPTSAEATINCRILPDETREATQAALVRAVGDPRVEIKPVADDGVGPPVDVTGDVPNAIRKIAGKMWPGAIVVPTMSTGATDSRHLRGAGIHAYGTNVSPISKAESAAGHAAHGPDERRPVRWLAEGARYLRDLTYELAR